MATLVAFSRPHTIIGTILSVVALATLADLATGRWAGWPQVVGVLIGSLATNVYITGLNQVLDVDIDRINKPHLPLPSGAMTRQGGLVASLACGAVALALGWWLSVPLGVTVTIGVVVGTAYSVPPIRLKRFPVPAALSSRGRQNSSSPGFASSCSSTSGATRTASGATNEKLPGAARK